jgi:hypothetical protein
VAAGIVVFQYSLVQDRDQERFTPNMLVRGSRAELSPGPCLEVDYRMAMWSQRSQIWRSADAASSRPSGISGLTWFQAQRLSSRAEGGFEYGPMILFGISTAFFGWWVLRSLPEHPLNAFSAVVLSCCRAVVLWWRAARSQRRPGGGRRRADAALERIVDAQTLAPNSPLVVALNQSGWRHGRQTVASLLYERRRT